MTIDLKFNLDKINLEKVKMGDTICDPSDWISYLKATLAYVCINFEGIKEKLKGFRIHFVVFKYI